MNIVLNTAISPSFLLKSFDSLHNVVQKFVLFPNQMKNRAKKKKKKIKGQGEIADFCTFIVRETTIGRRRAVDVALAANKLHRRAVLC